MTQVRIFHIKPDLAGFVAQWSTADDEAARAYLEEMKIYPVQILRGQDLCEGRIRSHAVRKLMLAGLVSNQISNLQFVNGHGGEL